MTERLLERWRALQDEVAALQTSSSRLSVAFTAGTKFVRQAIQVLMLALGAYLVLTQQASAGVMIATTILLARAIQPVEQLVGSWRMLIEARAAYLRLRDLSAHFESDEPQTQPAPPGRADRASKRLVPRAGRGAPDPPERGFQPRRRAKRWPSSARARPASPPSRGC